MTRRREPTQIVPRATANYRAAELVIAESGGAERVQVLTVKQVRIGTDPSNDVVLADPRVSRRHCEIRKTDEGYLLRDLGSSNGTRLGAASVKEALLDSGAEITIGQTRIRFLADVDKSPAHGYEKDRFGSLEGTSPRMREVFGVLERVAPSELTVLLLGETGTGKEKAAHAIHQASARASGPFVVLDCAAVQPNLIESELFGHERGAFTGANEMRHGAFERAAGGTLFLDEIGELRADLQPKLLRVLEQRSFARVGAVHETQVDVRILAATCRDLERAVREDQFRRDLYFRLSVVTVELPALRERMEDLPLISRGLLAPLGKELSPDALEMLIAHDFAGNIRELRNVLESAAQLSHGAIIEAGDLALRATREDLSAMPLAGKTLEEVERMAIEQTLKGAGGNKTKAAKALGISPSTLYEKLKRYGI